MTREVVEQIGHPNYNDFTLDYDYMVLKLNQPVDISEYPPIKLNDNPSKPETNDLLTVIGFGALAEGGPSYYYYYEGGPTTNRLQKVQVPANSNRQCRNQHSGIMEDIHFCAGFGGGGKDSCFGDSGGPIFENHNGTALQVGVVSWGEGCARPNKSSVYARVSAVYDWIQSQICDLATVNRPVSCGIEPPVSNVIYEDNFETNQGAFMGTNKRFNVVSYPGGEWSLRLRKRSVLKTEWFDILDNSQISLSFWLYADGMEVGDNFFFRARFNGENRFTDRADYVSGTDFENSAWVKKTVIIVVPKGKKQVQLQFKGDSNKGNDKVYIDNVVLQGYQN